MSDNYPSFTLPVESRDGVKKFEKLPINRKNLDLEYLGLITKTVPLLLQECHPLLRRRDMIARFVSKISECQGEKEILAAADCLDVEVGGKKMYWIRTSLEDIGELDDDNLAPNLVFRVLHEITESDYYLRSPQNTEDPKGDLNSNEYYYTEDEEMANRRSIKIIKQFYPDVHFRNIKYGD